VGRACALQVTEDLMQRLFADLMVYVVQADTALRILAHSAGLADYLRWPDQDLCRRQLTELFPELIGYEEDLMEMAAGHMLRLSLPMINRPGADGDDRRYMSLTVLPQPEVGGYLVLLVQDVTAQGHLDQQVMQRLNETRLLRTQLEAANKELGRLSEEKSALLRMAAHDLRAPLTVIKGYAELVIEEAGTVPLEETVQHLQVVLNRTREMTLLIDDLLDVERIESGRVIWHREPLDLALLVEQVVQGLLPLARQKGLKLEWSAAPNLPQAVADMDRIVQVLNNLVGNALKFTPAGRVLVDVRQANGEVMVEVTDSGPGLSEEEQTHLFQLFYRTRDARQRRIPGTGLGLSIVRAIVEQHGGRAYCRSQAGVGSTFGFTLPL